jgi:hypothetical protein
LRNADATCPRGPGKPLSSLTRFDGCDFAGCQVLSEILQGTDGLADELADELADVLLDFSRRRVYLFPRVRSRRDQVRNQNAGDQPVRDALSGIAADEEDMFLIGL